MARIWLENDGTFVKWAGTKPGTELTSVYGGLPLGRYGWITDLETAEGTLTLPAPKLALQFADLRRVVSIGLPDCQTVYTRNVHVVMSRRP